MDERELRAFHRAIQPVLQRTAPVESPSGPVITPADLNRIAWNVVLAYVANAAEQPLQAIPQQAQSGEGLLRDDEVRAAIERLCRLGAQPRLRAGPRAVDRFRSAARRLLGAYGWSPRRAEQAAGEMARVLQASGGG